MIIHDLNGLIVIKETDERTHTHELLPAHYHTGSFNFKCCIESDDPLVQEHIKALYYKFIKLL